MVKFAVKSDKGMVREINEDSYNVIAGYPGVPVSFIIADGMGGHNSGEVASKMAVDYVSNCILKMSGTIKEEDDIPGLVTDLIENANREVYEHSLLHAENAGMGTTLTIALIHNKKLFIGHVGDSRAYLMRDGEIKRITTDHTFVDELVRQGSLTDEEAASHPKKNLLTRAVGCMGSTEVDTYLLNVKSNDIFMLCSDGLTNMLADGEIREIVEGYDDLELACNELVFRANKNGGEDNITVILFKNEDK